MPLSLSYDDPLAAVFLRILAWEIENRTENPPRVQELVDNQVQTARQELGLSRIYGGAPHVVIQDLRKTMPPRLTDNYTPPRPTEPGWFDERKVWRLLNLPPHNAVRQLSDKPIHAMRAPEASSQTYREIAATLRNPAVPKLSIYLGIELPKGPSLEGKRGVYFLREAHGLYIGQTDEVNTRLYGHRGKKPLWWIFIVPQGVDETLARDALEAAEALLISFWNEIGFVTNDKRGSDQEPAFVYLQQAILLVEAASATLIWLVREQKTFRGELGLPAGMKLDIPFKDTRGNGWPKCYLRPPDADTQSIGTRKRPRRKLGNGNAVLRS